MREFLWSSGHLDWGFFALAVFTAICWLLGDLYWRLHTTRIGRLLAMLAAGWAIGAALIVLAFHGAGW